MRRGKEYATARSARSDGCPPQAGRSASRSQWDNVVTRKLRAGVSLDPDQTDPPAACKARRPLRKATRARCRSSQRDARCMHHAHLREMWATQLDEGELTCAHWFLWAWSLPVLYCSVVEPPVPPPPGAIADMVMAMPHLRGATAPPTVPTMSHGDGANGGGPAADTEAGARDGAVGVRDRDIGNS